MWHQTLRVGTATLVAGGGVGMYKLYRQHQTAMCPTQTSYCVTKATVVPSRASMLERMKTEKFDLIVIGGGATGSGVALDGATRGLKCSLLEADDFGSGTSCRSTKLLHGGVRYLEAAFREFDLSQLHLVCEALEERAHLMKCAPYMAKAVPIVMPLYTLWQIPYCWFGIQLYDFLAKCVTWFDTGVPDCFYVSKANALHFFPYLNPNKLRGALVYYDGQHNDARMNLAMALTSSIPAYRPGFAPAAIANHCRVVELLKDREGQLIGVRALDTLKNQEFNVYGRVIVNCSGPSSDIIRKLDDPNCDSLVETAAGSHLVLPRQYTAQNFGMVISQTSDERVAFILPWENSTLVGTTDIKAPLTETPQTTEAEVKYILKELSQYLKCDEETLCSDIMSTWSGLRPLVKAENADPNAATCTISRHHRIVREPSGLVSIVGGKWTTYRRMAQDTVDYIIRYRLGGLNPTERPCQTKHLKFFPAIPLDAELGDDLDAFSRRLQKTFALSYEQTRHLIQNYGYQAEPLCELGQREKLLTPLSPGYNFLKAEVLFAVRNELAETAADVLGRRLRLAFLDRDAAAAVLNDVVALMAKELKWGTERQEKELQSGTEFLDTMCPKKNVLPLPNLECALSAD